MPAVSQRFWPTFWILAPLHAALPPGLRLVYQRAGFDPASYAVAAIHVLFPLLYLALHRFLPRSHLQLLALLVLNHAVMGAVGLLLWLWPG